MSRNMPSGPPPGWLGGLLKRAEELLRRLAGSLRDAAGSLEEEGRRLWDPVGARLRPARQRVNRARVRLREWIRPRVAPLAGAVERRWASIRPRIRSALGALCRRRPSPRQAAVLALVLLGAGWLLWERCGLKGCPDVESLTSYQPGGASVVLDRDGEPFADLAPMEYEVVALDSLPPWVAQAFVAVEDRRFFDHEGVDWFRSVGALWADIRARGLVQGSSTIPMQLSRTLFPDRIRREEKTFRRKLLEVRVAGEIEERFTKREILELYLNHVYLGGGSYGIQAASRYYFDKEATELELEEAALLAALPRAPSHYDPRRHPEAARARRDLVLTLMEKQDVIPFRVAHAARQRDLAVADETDRDPDGDRLAPYFVEHVRRLLADELGERLYAEPLRIVTTLDARAQEAAEAELEAQLRTVERGTFGRFRGPHYGDGEAGYLQGAVVLMDARSGDVRAWVGGRDYDRSRYDRARLARRQAGSAFKPFVYAAALEAGFPPSQPILDAPYRLARAGAPDWEPDNYSGGFEGRMTLRDALVRSQNIPSVRLAAAVGEERVSDFARRTGIAGEVPASPVAALGVTAVSPVEMTAAYASFANLGTRVTPRFVVRVEDAEGRVVWEPAPEPARARVMEPAIAYLLTDMLRDVVDRGTGTGVRGAGFHGAAAGKTGTTSDATDVWFVGYTPELVGTVWVGYDEVRPLPYRATGGGVAAPIWGRIMARVHADGPMPRWADRPPEVVARWVDPETGMPLEEGCRPRWDGPRQELFLLGQEPRTICPWSGSRYGYYRIGRWLGDMFGYDDEPAARIPGEPDPDLGYPRLPRAGGTDEAGHAREPDRVDRGAEAWERDRDRHPHERWRGDERRRRGGG
ncbi:MAG: PBP1A family penicillin-binding protein [Gemmatimonadetes bacterium]|nr:PBP1A family penicillin-binding protein [Gemmatimonadota bacterium]